MVEKDPPFMILRELTAAGTATSIFNPMDVIKIRMQVQNCGGTKPVSELMYKGFSHTGKKIIAEEGIIGLWKPGLLASNLREFSYSAIRVGMYPSVKRIFSNSDGSDIGLFKKLCAGLITGALGSSLANPTDLVKIRFQGEAGLLKNGIYQTGLSKGLPPSYKHTFDAFYQITKNEGIAGLYKGVSATAVRAALLTSAQLASYDHTKYMLKNHNLMKEGVPLHITASLVSGLCATTACAPADIIKSRIMNDKGLYKNSLDCLVKTIQQEGPKALFKGWVPSYLRLGPHFIISLPLLEQFRKFFGLSHF